MMVDPGWFEQQLTVFPDNNATENAIIIMIVTSNATRNKEMIW